MQSKGKRTMVYDNKCELLPPLVDGSGVEEEMAEWVQVPLRTRFWEPCSRGHTIENRADGCLFCLQCYEVFCPHCTHDETGHCILKVRRYVYRSVVLAKDMHELNVDVSRVQGKVDVSQDDFSGPEAEHRYRSLQAHMMEPLIVEEHLTPQLEPEPQLEYESKSEVEVDHRVESSPLEQTDAPPVMVNLCSLNNGSFRMRPRKQIAPLRAPFF